MSTGTNPLRWSPPCFRIILESIFRIGCGDRTFGVPVSCLPDINPMRPREIFKISKSLIIFTERRRRIENSLVTVSFVFSLLQNCRVKNLGIVWETRSWACQSRLYYIIWSIWYYMEHTVCRIWQPIKLANLHSKALPSFPNFDKA